MQLCRVVHFIFCHAECHYAECRCADCRGALSITTLKAKGCYAESYIFCRYAERPDRYADTQFLLSTEILITHSYI